MCSNKAHRAGRPGGSWVINVAAYLKGEKPDSLAQPGLQHCSAETGRPSRKSKMKERYSFSCLLLLSLGACFPPDGRPERGEPGEPLWLETSWRGTADDTSQASLWREGLRRRSSKDLRSLFSVAKELQGFGKERAGFRFRFGRQEESQEGEEVGFLWGDGEKRSGTLGNLAEELNGYNRKKGGFSFRFGRR